MYGNKVTTARPGATQTVTTSGTSAASSNGFGSSTFFVRVVCTEDCHIVFGASPTATTSDLFLPANTVEYFTVTSGQKIAAIQNSAGGSLYVTEMSAG